MSSSPEDLCLLCVVNLAAPAEVDLEKQRPATDLLQQILNCYQIKVDIKDSTGRICNQCMAEVLQMSEILRSWHEAQGRLQSQETGISDEEEEEVDAENDDDDDEENDAEEEEDEGHDNEDDVVDIESADWENQIGSDYEALDDMLSADYDEYEETSNDNESVAHMAIDALVLTSHGGILGKLVRGRTEMYCYYCHKMFQGGTKLRHHCYFEHSQLYYACFDCGITFSDVEHLENHREQKQHKQLPQQQQLNADEEPSQLLHYRCHKCGRIFDRVFSVIRHERDVHRQSHYQCPNANCRRIFETKRGYSIHMKKHAKRYNIVTPIKPLETIETAIKEQEQTANNSVFVCAIKHCRKAFQTRAQLAYHKVTHTGEEFYCIICSRRLSSRSNMRRHIRTVHNPIIQEQKKRRRADVKRELDGIGDDDDVLIDLARQQRQIDKELNKAFDSTLPSSSSSSSMLSNFIVIGKSPNQSINIKIPHPPKPQGGHFISLK